MAIQTLNNSAINSHYISGENIKSYCIKSKQKGVDTSDTTN